MNRSLFEKGLKDEFHYSPAQRKKIVKASVNREHWKTKCTIVMEELAELQQEVSKQIRGCGDRIGLLEEMADVCICMQFLMSIFEIDDKELENALDVKLRREKGRC